MFAQPCLKLVISRRITFKIIHPRLSLRTQTHELPVLGIRFSKLFPMGESGPDLRSLQRDLLCRFPRFQQSLVSLHNPFFAVLVHLVSEWQHSKKTVLRLFRWRILQPPSRQFLQISSKIVGNETLQILQTNFVEYTADEGTRVRWNIDLRLGTVMLIVKGFSLLTSRYASVCGVLWFKG